MKTVTPPASQTMQRVRVGMIGLAVVVLLIGLASVIFSAANREQPMRAVDATKADVVANMTIANTALPTTGSNEPLAELGVAPSAGNSAAPAATPQ